MQVILFKNIERLGMQGEVVNVKAGYYRNYLGPHGVAVEATPSALTRLDLKRKKLQVEAETQLASARDLSGRIGDAQIKFVMKVHDGDKLFGSVSAPEIAAKLVELGFEVERRQVLLKEPIKTTGKHEVRVRMLGTVEARVTVVVESDAPPEEPRKPKAAVVEAAEAEEAVAEEGSAE